MCEVYRISHSHFLGGPPVWTQADRDKAIWYQVEKARTCQACGTHPDDWDPAKGGRRDAYVVSVTRCPGCAALEQFQEAREAKASTEPPGRGERVGLKAREV